MNWRAEQRAGHLGRGSADNLDNFDSVTSSAKSCPFCDSLERLLPYFPGLVVSMQRKTGRAWWEGWVEIVVLFVAFVLAPRR